jgi:hypothetical protein
MEQRMTMNKKFLRGWRDLADRYGVTTRTAQRMCEDGRLPEPSYIPDSRFPLWQLDLLDKHDRLIITTRIRRRPAAAPTDRGAPEAA